MQNLPQPGSKPPALRVQSFDQWKDREIQKVLISKE